MCFSLCNILYLKIDNCVTYYNEHFFIKVSIIFLFYVPTNLDRPVPALARRTSPLSIPLPSRVNKRGRRESIDRASSQEKLSRGHMITSFFYAIMHMIPKRGASRLTRRRTRFFLREPRAGLSDGSVNRTCEIVLGTSHLTFRA